MSTASGKTNASAAHRVRPFYWSLRRELWENRSFYIAPAVVAILFLVAAIFGAFKAGDALTRFDLLPAATQKEVVAMPYAAASALVMIVAVIVALFYCLDALYGERRDRSVLFWKSLPVSDWTTVLSKLAMPMLVMPVIVFVVAMATQLVVLVGHLITWSVHGMSVGKLLAMLPFVDMPLGVGYFLIAFSIWFAPVYAWLLLVSAWAQRSPVVWASVPWIVALAFERIALRTSYVYTCLRDRLLGAFDAAFTLRDASGNVVERMPQDLSRLGHSAQQSTEHVPDVVRFLSNPQVWIGLAIAAALIVATIWLRRRQESQST